MFKVKNAVGSHAYELELSRKMHIHPVFHVSLLDSAMEDSLSGQIALSPPPVEVDNEVKYLIKEIFNFYIYRRRLQYLVK